MSAWSFAPTVRTWRRQPGWQHRQYCWLVDPSRSVTATVLAGQLQRAYFSALPDLAVGRVAELIGTEFTEFTVAQQAEIATGLRGMRTSAGSTQPGGWTFDDLLERDNVAGQNAALNNVAYYAGAVAFMFLLFAAAQSALGILDDQEAGILDRIAAGPGGIGVVINGRFLFLVLQGLVQTALIFAVAWLVYGVDVPGNFGPWAMITLGSAVLAAGLGLLLVTGCQTRAQAQVLPTVVILIMSAIGGSMVPRFFMPHWLQQLGWATPNTWALEAYSGVFWRSESALQLAADLFQPVRYRDRSPRTEPRIWQTTGAGLTPDPYNCSLWTTN